MQISTLEPVGAEVSHLDLAAVLADRVELIGLVEDLRWVLAEHGVVVVRHQELDDVQFTAFLRAFGDLVFTSVIPRNVRLAEAPSYGQPIYSYAPTSSGALAYRSLAEEVIRRASEA